MSALERFNTHEELFFLSLNFQLKQMVLNLDLKKERESMSRREFQSNADTISQLGPNPQVISAATL